MVGGSVRGAAVKSAGVTAVVVKVTEAKAVGMTTEAVMADAVAAVVVKVAEAMAVGALAVEEMTEAVMAAGVAVKAAEMTVSVVKVAKVMEAEVTASAVMAEVA